MGSDRNEIDDLVDGVARSILTGWKGAPSGVSYGGGGRGWGSRHNTYPGARIDPEREEERETFLEKRLRHVEDLTNEEWRLFAEAIKCCEMEVSEKLDGSARLEFGVREGRLWFKTKNSPMLESADGLPVPVVAAFEGLSAIRDSLIRRWPQGLQNVVCEVLYGRVPNTIEYGQNMLVVHGGATKDQFHDIFEGLNLPGWSVEYKPVWSRSPFAEMDLSSVMSFRRDVLEHVKSYRSSFGPAGGMIEGLVFTGSQGSFKVVDRKMFTELNRFMWKYREMLDRGMKVDESYEPGILGGLRRQFAEHCGCKTIMYSRLAQQIAEKHGGSLERFLEEKYIGPQHLISFLPKLSEASERLLRMFEEFTSSDKRIVLEGREFSMPEEIVERNLSAFGETQRRIAFMVQAIEGRDTSSFVKSLLGPMFERRIRSISERVNIGSGTKLLTQYADKLKVRGHDVSGAVPLGTGTQGTAFEIQGGKVLKLTSDSSEAISSLRLKGKNTKYIAKIYDVFVFPQTKVFGIVQEKLIKLSSHEDQELTDAIRDLSLILTLSPRSQTDFETILLKVHDWVEFEEAVTDAAEYSEGYANRAREALEILQKFKVDMMMSELVALGIKFRDYHSDNIMKRGSEYVLIDIGYSRAPGNEGDIPVLENEIGKIVRELLVTEDDTEPAAMASGDNAEKLLRQNARLLLQKKNLNVMNARALGSGEWGTAFDIGGGKVLKVTQDKKEAIASFKIVGKELKYVVNIYDVFMFRGTETYGIVQQKLSPLSDQESKEFNAAMIITGLPRWLDSEGNDWEAAKAKTIRIVKGEATGTRKRRVYPDLAAADYMRKANEFWDLISTKYNLKAMNDELLANGIKFSDYQASNMMKRGSDYVVIDLGQSNVEGGAQPPVLEKKTLGLNEDRDPETVGVTIGRFQPFHKGHAEMVRKLAKDFRKVIVLVAGNREGKDNPFSYDLRLEMIQRSLPDLANKMEIHRAEFQGKPSGFIPGILAEMIEEEGSSIDQSTAFSIVVGDDRYQNVRDQLERARGYEELGLNLDLIMVKKMPEVSDSEGRISGTRIRQLLGSDDAELSGLFDPHVTSDETGFKQLLAKMRAELGVQKEGVVNEKLSTVGKDSLDQTLKLNAKRLMAVKNIDVEKLHALGNGEMGIAYDMGGGKVLKVTTDAAEAKSSNLIKGRNLTHVVRIDDVFRFGKSVAKEPLYGIVQEKLTPLSDAEKGEFRHAIAFVRENGQLLEMLATRNWDDFTKAIYALAYDDAENEISADARDRGDQVDRNSPLFQRQAKRSAENMQRFVISRLQQFGVREMSRELQSVGIQFADYHEGNLMKRGGQFVITDLGASKSKGPEPDVFEGIIQGIVERVLDEIGGHGNSFGLGSSQAGVRAQSSSWSSGANIGSELPRKTRRLTSPDEMGDEDDR